MDIARGSANEVETQLLAAVRLGFVKNDQVKVVMNLALEVQRILKGLVRSLENSKKTDVKG
ncbi:MAG: four helix bundle protein [Phycisphaerae bacterium]|nr:four helix bundle protein [Phycisphaerae bacterium]